MFNTDILGTNPVLGVLAGQMYLELKDVLYKLLKLVCSRENSKNELLVPYSLLLK